MPKAEPVQAARMQSALVIYVRDYRRVDPYGEGKQLQVPGCINLKGPALDCTHSNTGQESQEKTVPSATASGA